MHPAYSDFLQTFAKIQKETQDFSLEDSRIVSRRFFMQNVVKEPIHKLVDRKIRGQENLIPIRIFIPDESKDFPVLLFFHAGGWVFGSIEEADSLCRQIAHQARCIVVAVDYRLAPEYPFPTGLQDCYEATKWICENAHLFGGDRTRIAVGGESSGANLAAAVALLSRDNGEPTLAFQLLLYPATTDDLDEKVYAESPDQSFMTLENMKMFWELYLEKPADGNHPYASPLKAKSLANLPPAFVVTAEYDPLHVEGEAYAKRLSEFHVPVVVKQYRKAIHYFLSLPISELPQRREALQDIRQYLMHAFEEM